MLSRRGHRRSRTPVSGRDGGISMRFRSRFRLAALLTAAGLLPLAITGTAAAAHAPGHTIFKGKHSILTAAQVERLAAHATHRSIIIFKNQLSSLPAKG